VVNAGSIAGNTTAAGKGIYIQSGGLVTNQSGGVITGHDGIFVKSGAVTVVNAGTIGGSIDAVGFVDGQTNRPVIDLAAVFIGTVTGGNTIGGTSISTLELASISTLELASAAASGTLTGIGTQFVDFVQVTVDAGAIWLLTGPNTIATGVTPANLGTVEFTAGSAGYVLHGDLWRAGRHHNDECGRRASRP
jgi:hypothetical protein